MARLAGGSEPRRWKMTTTAGSTKPDPIQPHPWRSSNAKSEAVRATQSLLRAIVENCEAVKAQNLDKFLTLANETLDRDFHASLRRYLSGERAMGEPDLMGVARVAFRERLLNSDQVSHLGYTTLVRGRAADIRDIDSAIRAVRSDRDRTRRTFDEGVDRLLKGLTPNAVKAIGRNGTEIRAPLNDSEMANSFSNWISKIEGLGGEVTTENWAPAWYWEAEQYFTPSGEEGLSGYDLEQMGASLEAASSECHKTLTGSLPLWHPSKVRGLKLWFGGREWSSWQHAIEDGWWTERRGDDLSDLFRRA